MSKKFYQSAEVAETNNAYAIELDGRPVKTPAGKPLAIPSKDLAQAMADEWQAQGDVIDPHSMPVTGLVNTSLDRTGTERPAMTEAVLRFAETDLLCYRAENPDDLIELQQQTWQPLLDWAEDSFGARLEVTSGILPVAQDPAAVKTFIAPLNVFDDLQFTAVSSLTAACGSLILALALAHRRISHIEAFEASELDQNYQMRQWGSDDEVEARQRALMSDITAANTILELVRQ